MKLYIEDEKIGRFEIKDVRNIEGNVGILFFFVTIMISESDTEELERKLSEKMGIKCIVLDAIYSRVEMINLKETEK